MFEIWYLEFHTDKHQKHDNIICDSAICYKFFNKKAIIFCHDNLLVDEIVLQLKKNLFQENKVCGLNKKYS